MLLHDNPIDVGALHPLLKACCANLDAIGITRAIGTALFDAGYASEANFTADCEASLLVAMHNEDGRMKKWWMEMRKIKNILYQDGSDQIDLDAWTWDSTAA